MRIIDSDRHHLHRGEKEMYRGELVPGFEKPERADDVRQAVQARNIGPILEPKQLPVTAIERVHAPRYIRFLEEAWEMWSALGHTHDALPAVWPVRGFRDHGAQRVAILDVDYHHGTGRQTIFYDRSDVLFVSIHGDPKTEYPSFLGHANETGRGAGEGFNENHPLPAGSSNAAWFDALGDATRRLIEYKPDALVVSLGVGTFADDPISKFQLRSSCAWGHRSRRSTCRPCHFRKR